MILVGNQRGGGKDLARHLMKAENERVELHDLRGFASDTLQGAFQESYALSRNTRCTQHLFSLSLNPPPEEDVSKEVFEDAITRIEDKLGLSGQPRAIVFHEKNGRRHAHAVWCRIDADAMRAVPLPFTHQKLQGIARELYVENGWRMPLGFVDQSYTNPANYSLEEWQQAKRAGRDPEQTKTLFQDAWAISDSREGFANALKERGFVLARGDRRGFVAVDHEGEAYAIARWVGLKTKQVAGRLGDPASLPNVEEAKAQAARAVAQRLEALKAEQEAKARAAREAFAKAKTAILSQHHKESADLTQRQALRERQETEERQAKFRRGLMGFIDRLTGRRKRIEKENTIATERALMRDHDERADLARKQETVRRRMQAEASALEAEHRDIARALGKDISRLNGVPSPTKDHARAASKDIQTKERPAKEHKTRDGPKQER